MNMTTVPSDKLKEMQQQLAEKDVEIAALKEQVNALEDKAVILRATIKAQEHWQDQAAQQAAVIEQMREAIRLKDEALLNLLSVIDSEAYPTIQNNGYDAVAIQPSPGILQDRDEQVAEACAKVAAPKVGIRYDDYNLTIRNGTVKALRSGEWRKYL